MSNSVLLNLNEVPKFDELQSSEVENSLKELISEARQEISRIKDINSVDWSDVMDPLTAALEKVGRAWGVVAHINSVNDTESWRNEYNKMIPVISEFYTEVSQDLELFEIFKKINKDNFDNLTSEQQQKLKHDLRDFGLSGASLQGEERKTFAKL
ncbi:MAG: M3 family peptidase, partial [Neisseriaceae bacterium]|nr:M3 family peptidase [Neisseriaceae bacterium]